MKKIFLVSILSLAIVTFTNAQIVFNSGQTLQKGAFSVGINPAWADFGDGDFALFMHGGYGLGHNSDLGLKLGFGWGNETYFGIDYEKTFLSGKPSFSATIGGHYWHYFGIDLGGTVTFPIQNIYLSTGLDADIVFGEDGAGDLEMYVPMWLPIELEFYLKKHLSLIFEADIKLTDHAFTIINGGVSIYF
ncbi:MAG: hypothetical protein JXR51_06780 [Bacteroidales bacterium]|nr:hypothetical protein [Bacteroidales bacterium]MBN2756868.1 hypothetical protein [Bacteroidales bacterium]